MTTRRYILLIIILFCSLTGFTQPLSDEARVSILSCAPGQELYARYGHTAIRICDPQYNMDIVFNYGLFSFDTDHFYWKFIKGETWYQLGVQTTTGFLREYVQTQRVVSEQILNLSHEEKNAVYQALQTNYLPENREYLYNFVFDNCATRPYNLILSAIRDTLSSTYIGHEGQTYRQFLSHYTGKGSWADFGINLLFGSRADKMMQAEERLFLPEEVMWFLSNATRSDGTPIVSRQHVTPFEIQPTPWWATCYFGLSLLAILLTAVSYWDRRRRKLSWGIDLVMGIVYVIVFAIVTFLTFFSIHPLVGFGWRLLIIPAIHLCARLLYILPPRS